MIATIVCVVLLIWLAVHAAYRCYKKHWSWILVYLVLYCVVLFLSKNDAFTSLLNSRASYVFETITDGFNTVMVLLIALYTIIILLTLQFVLGFCSQPFFLFMYLLYSVAKLGFLLYNNASCLILGIISTVELLFLNPLLGLAAYGNFQFHYHFAPYLPEFKESDWFGGALLIASCGLSIISLIYVFIP